MTRKNDGEMTVKLPADDKEALRLIAAENDRTLVQEVRRAIRLYLESIPRKGTR